MWRGVAAFRLSSRTCRGLHDGGLRKRRNAAVLPVRQRRAARRRVRRAHDRAGDALRLAARWRRDISVDAKTAWTGGSWQDYYTMDTESDPDGLRRHSRAVNDLLLHGNRSNGVDFLFRNVTVSTP